MRSHTPLFMASGRGDRETTGSMPSRLPASAKPCPAVLGEMNSHQAAPNTPVHRAAALSMHTWSQFRPHGATKRQGRFFLTRFLCSCLYHLSLCLVCLHRKHMQKAGHGTCLPVGLLSVLFVGLSLIDIFSCQHSWTCSVSACLLHVL